MIDPPRLREGGAEAPPELSELFRDAKKPEPLTPATDAQLLAQITSLGAAPAAPLVKGWLMAGGAVVVAGALALLAQRDPAPGAAPMPMPMPAPSASAAAAIDAVPTAPAPEAQSPPEGKRAPAASAAKVARGEASSSDGAASSSEDALAGEARLLNRAHAVMAADPRTAYAIASEHAKRYPRGQLAAERELILVEALVKLGRVREAEARGRALRKRAPSGIYGERLDTLLKAK